MWYRHFSSLFWRNWFSDSNFRPIFFNHIWFSTNFFCFVYQKLFLDLFLSTIEWWLKGSPSTVASAPLVSLVTPLHPLGVSPARTHSSQYINLSSESVTVRVTRRTARLRNSQYWEQLVSSWEHRRRWVWWHPSLWASDSDITGVSVPDETA